MPPSAPGFGLVDEGGCAGEVSRIRWTYDHACRSLIVNRTRWSRCVGFPRAGFAMGVVVNSTARVGSEGGVERSIIKSYKCGFSKKRRSVVPVFRNDLDASEYAKNRSEEMQEIKN